MSSTNCGKPQLGLCFRAPATARTGTVDGVNVTTIWTDRRYLDMNLLESVQQIGKAADATRTLGGLVLQQLDRDARALANFMSELSEEAFHAGWMAGLEFELWRALTGGPRQYGRLRLSDEQIARLGHLSEAAKGWITFDDMEEEMHVPINEWKQRFNEWSQQQR